MARTLLPQKSSMLELMITQRAFDALTPTPEEIERWHVRDVMDEDRNVTGTQWDQEANEPIEIELEGAAVDLIKAELKKLDEKKELTMGMVSTFDAFVNPPSPAVEEDKPETDEA